MYDGLDPLLVKKWWHLASPLEKAISDIVNKNVKDLKHTLTIPIHSSPVYNLNLWQDLKQIPEQAALIQQWQQTRKFAHLSTDSLINLLLHKLEPTIQTLTLLQQLQLSKSFNLAWLPNILTRQKPKPSSLALLLKELNVLKRAFYKTLYSRVMRYQNDNLRHQDDDLNWISQQIPEDLRRKYSLVSSKARFQMSDDLRILIYDHLKSVGAACAMIDPIIVDNRQEPYKLPGNREASIEIHGLINRIETKLGLCKEVNDTSTPLNRSSNKYLNWLTRFTQESLSTIKKMRYIIALISTLSLYFVAVVPLSIALSPILPSSAMTLLQNVLLYGFALFPAWHLLYKSFQSFKNTVGRYLNQNTISQMLAATHLVKEAQILSLQLQAGILDTPFFNIQSVQASYLSIQAQLDLLHNQLSSSNSAYKTQEIKDLQLESIQLLAKQAQSLKKQVGLIASHITKRIQQDMPKLILDIRRGLLLALPSSQMTKYRAFVVQFGTAHDLNHFEQAVSVIPKFHKELQSQKFDIHNPAHNPYYPWGMRLKNAPNFEGWKTLFDFTEAPACYKSLLNIMQGKASVTLDNYETTCLQLPLAMRRDIQKHLFNCLTSMPVHYVHFLSSEDKMTLLRWGVDNQQAIEDISSLIQSFIEEPAPIRDNHPRLQNMTEVVGLLEGARYVYHLQNKSFEIKNQLINLINQSTGSNPFAFYALRFLKDNEKKSTAEQLIKRRVTWLLSHPSNSEITFEDQQLFHANYVDPSVFNQALTNHQNLKTFTSQTFLVLQKFYFHGLVDKTFLNQYQHLKNQQEIEQPISRRAVYA